MSDCVQKDPLPGKSYFPPAATPERVAILGLGNVLLSDEGVGVHAAIVLRTKFDFSPKIDVIDGGTMGLDLLPIFQDRRRILIVDAVDFGKPPGYIESLAGEAIRSVLNSKLSVHHIGLADVLLAAKLTRETPLELCLVGIQPKSLDPGIRMTVIVQERLDEIFALVVKKLQTWNVTVSRCDEPVPELSGFESSFLPFC